MRSLICFTTKRWRQIAGRLARLLVAVALSWGISILGWYPGNSAISLAALPPGNAITDPRTLLRLALPIENQPIQQVQSCLDDMPTAWDYLATRPGSREWSEIDRNTGKAIEGFTRHKSDILSSIPAVHRPQASTLIEQIGLDLTDLQASVKDQNSEKVRTTRAQILDRIDQLEALMVAEFPFQVPEVYRNLPQLQGRATVVLETSQGIITLIADGYSAPVTAGDFVDLVQRGFYNGLEFTRAEESYVLQTGDPKGPEEGFIDSKTGQYRAIPLEILVKGDAEPLYGITLEDAGRALDQPVLPFSAYGTVAMARPGDDPNGGSSQFFFLLFEPDLTPAGLNLLDGRYAVFGYVVDGQDVLRKLKQGDRIDSARVAKGVENLVHKSV